MPNSNFRFTQIFHSSFVPKIIPALFLFVFLLPGHIYSQITETPDTLTLPSETLPLDTLPPVNGSDTLDIPETQEPVRRPPRRIGAETKEVEDTLPRAAIPWYTEEQLQNPFTLKPNFVDTTLLGLQIYDFAAQNGIFYAHKGNPGHAVRPLVFNPDFTPGLKLNEDIYFGNNFFKHEQLRYYRPKHVFTELFYLTGSEREQLFYAKHAQKVHETTNIGLQYRLVNSPGASNRVRAGLSSIYLTGDYLHPTNRYQALASVIQNRTRNHESGGLSNHVDFEKDPNSDNVFMSRAESWSRDLSVNLRHFYQTGFYLPQDTAGNYRFINLGRINHDFTYKRNAYTFNDTERPLSFYDFPKLDSLSTYDSTVVHRITNMISWSNFPISGGRRTFPFNFRIFIKQTFHTIKQTDQRPPEAPIADEDRNRIYYHNRRNFSSVVQGIELQSDQRKLLSLGGYANVTIGGYNDEDFHAGAFLNFGRIEKNYNIEALARYSLMEASYFMKNISVNNVRWENEFNKMQVANLRGRLISPYVTLEGNYYLLNNAVYLNDQAFPVQNEDNISFFSLSANSVLKAGPVGFRNQVVLQRSTSKDFEKYPDIISYHSVFVNFSLFDKALINQVGFDFHFNNGYQAMAWMPVTRGFYAQDNHLMRNKYLVDVFWNGKVGNARLFIKYQNLLPLAFIILPHYDIPFYPISESMFKFGVSWMFFD